MGEVRRGLKATVDEMSSRAPAELAARARQTVERMASELRELIAAEQVGRSDYEREVQASREREKQYQKVLATLEGTGPKLGRPTNAELAKRAASRRSPEAQRANALAALRTMSRPMTVMEVQEVMGVGSRETARKALEALREGQQVRMAGVVMSPNGRTPSNTYALMSTGEVDGAAGTSDD